MSLLHSSNDSFLLSHSNFISNIYKQVHLEDDTCKSYGLASKLFCIKSKDKVKYCKRSHNSDEIIEETAMVKRKFYDFIKNIPDSIKNTISKLDYDIEDIRKYAQGVFESTKFEHNGLNGGNNSDKPLKCLIRDEYFLLPPRSRFLCGCVKEQCRKLNGNKYNIVIADPPWWNKYIRRLKNANDKMSYSMMYNEDIASIPVKELFAHNCIIAIWCTNAPSNINAVKNIIFPRWGVKYIATWFWMKVTLDLEPLCNFGTGCKKQPYERVIIGSVGNVKEVPEIMFASVPSALHSHKPPLLDLLSSYMDEEPAVLELFARYLLPETTSVGYEPLKLQHISLYEDT